MLVADGAKSPPAPRLCGRIEQLERTASIVELAEMPERSRLNSAWLPWSCYMIRYGGVIGRDEFIRPELSPDAHLWTARHPNVEPDAAVPVNVLDQVPEP